MLVLLLWLSFPYGGYNGANVVALTEILLASVRNSFVWRLHAGRVDHADRLHWRQSRRAVDDLRCHLRSDSHIDGLPAGRGNAGRHGSGCLAAYLQRARDDGLAPTWLGRDHSQETPAFQALPN
jgi:hypothetical protein